MIAVSPDHTLQGGGAPASAESAALPVAAASDAEADRQRKIRLLVLASLYPNAAQPRHGIFVEERLRHLVDSGRITATVVAPVPWFPFRHRHFGAYAAFAAVPAHEERHGICVAHPRYPVIPKVGMNIAPLLMYRALLPVLRKRRAGDADFDLIDAHYFYPDGVAATLLGTALEKPVVITARGSDINVIARHRRPGKQIRRAANRAAAVVAVSRALKDKLIALGAEAEKITVLRNGVDLDRFEPRDRGEIRARLALSGPVWLAVGNLVESKGVHLTLAALADVPDAMLLVVGQGPEDAHLHQLADRLGIAKRVRFLGSIAHSQLCDYYNAADVMVLASSREGMPNVVLESLACGTPVVAAPFDGVTELLDVPEAGEIAGERSSDAIAAAWGRVRDRAPQPALPRRHAESFGWGQTVCAQAARYQKVLSQAPAGAAAERDHE
jgi:glycosyltransferase involved in cell wall biosynthesis